MFLYIYSFWYFVIIFDISLVHIIHQGGPEKNTTGDMDSFVVNSNFCEPPYVIQAVT